MIQCPANAVSFREIFVGMEMKAPNLECWADHLPPQNTLSAQLLAR